jgi:hypothetical protein
MASILKKSGRALPTRVYGLLTALPRQRTTWAKDSGVAKKRCSTVYNCLGMGQTSERPLHTHSLVYQRRDDTNWARSSASSGLSRARFKSDRLLNRSRQTCQKTFSTR